MSLDAQRNPFAYQTRFWPSFLMHDVIDCDLTSQSETETCKYLEPCKGKNAIFLTDFRWMDANGDTYSISRLDLIKVYVYLTNLSQTYLFLAEALKAIEPSARFLDGEDSMIRAKNSGRLTSLHNSQLYAFVECLWALERRGKTPMSWEISYVDLESSDQVKHRCHPTDLCTYPLQVALSYLPNVSILPPDWIEKPAKLLDRSFQKRLYEWRLVPPTAWAMQPYIKSQPPDLQPRKWTRRLRHKLGAYEPNKIVTGSQYGTFHSSDSLPFHNLQSASSERVPLIR